jgi:hypothetical protein
MGFYIFGYLTVGFVLASIFYRAVHRFSHVAFFKDFYPKDNDDRAMLFCAIWLIWPIWLACGAMLGVLTGLRWFAIVWTKLLD